MIRHHHDTSLHPFMPSPTFTILCRFSGSFSTSAGADDRSWRDPSQRTGAHFKELKNDLSIRPIYHQLETRIEAHIFVAFLAYCLQVALKQRLTALAPGLTARAVLEKLAAIQMIEVELPTTDNRLIVLSRYTEPEKDQLLLLQQLKLQLPLSRRQKSAL